MKKLLFIGVVALAARFALASPVTLSPAFTRLFPGQTVDLTATCPIGPDRPEGAAVRVIWSVKGPHGGTLAGDDPWRRTFIAPMVKDHGRISIKVTVKLAHGALVGRAVARVEVVQDPGLAEVLTKTLMPSIVGDDWLVDRPSLTFLPDPTHVPLTTGGKLPIPPERFRVIDMHFLDDPAMGDLDRTVLMATSAGLYGLSLRHKGLIPVPAADGLFASHLAKEGWMVRLDTPDDQEVRLLAVRPPGSTADNPHHVVFLVTRKDEKAASGKRDFLHVLGADGVVRPFKAKQESLQGRWEGDRFLEPPDFLTESKAMTMDGQGNIYVADWSRIWRIDPKGAATLLAGSPTAPWTSEFNDGKGQFARFRHIDSLVYQPQEGCLYCHDADRLRRVSLAGAVTTVLGDDGWGGEFGVPPPGQAKVLRSYSGKAWVPGMAALGAGLLMGMTPVHHPDNTELVVFQPSTGEMENLAHCNPAKPRGREGPVGVHRGASNPARERAELPAPVARIAASPEGSCFVYVNREPDLWSRVRTWCFAHLDLAAYANLPMPAAAAEPQQAAPAAARPKEKDEHPPK